jgi:hypothetical protein
MQFDEIDLKIIKEFCKLEDNEICSLSKITKKVYDKSRDTELMQIKTKIKRLSREGIFVITQNQFGRNQYNMIKEMANYGKFKFPNYESNAVSIKVNGRWLIREI